MRCIKVSFFLKINIFLFFVMHIAFNLLYDIDYQYAYWKLKGYRLRYLVKLPFYLIVGRGILSPLILWRPPHPHYITYPHLFNFVQPALPSLSPPTPTPTDLSVVLFLWLNGWSRHIWCAFLPNDIMDLHLSSLGTLVKRQAYWDLTHKFFTSTLIGYHTHTHTHMHTKTHRTLRDQ